MMPVQRRGSKSARSTVTSKGLHLTIQYVQYQLCASSKHVALPGNICYTPPSLGRILFPVCGYTSLDRAAAFVALAWISLRSLDSWDSARE
jgi:hypothetical protein